MWGYKNTSSQGTLDRLALKLLDVFIEGYFQCWRIKTLKKFEDFFYFFEDKKNISIENQIAIKLSSQCSVKNVTISKLKFVKIVL